MHFRGTYIMMYMVTNIRWILNCIIHENWSIYQLNSKP